MHLKLSNCIQPYRKCLSKNLRTYCWDFFPQLWGMSQSWVSIRLSAPWLAHVSCIMRNAFSTPATGKSLSCEPLMKSIGFGQAMLAMWG